MSTILGRLTPHQRTVSRVRKQLHAGEPIDPTPDWGRLLEEPVEEWLASSEVQHTVLAYLEHPDVPSQVAREAVVQLLRRYLNPTGSVRLSAIRAALADDRLTVEEKIEIVGNTWSSRTEIGAISRSGRPLPSGVERSKRLMSAFKASGSREAVIALQFLVKAGGKWVSSEALQDVVQTLLAPCTDEVLEVLWALIDDDLAAGSRVGSERMRELIDQAHLVLR